MKRIVLAVLLLRSICVLSQDIPDKPKPKVRAITAFVRIDQKNFQKQIEDTVVVLHRAESEFKSIGYEVDRWVSRFSLARSISTFFFAASSVLTELNAAEQASIYWPTLDS